MRRVYCVVNRWGWPVERRMNYSMAEKYACDWSITRPSGSFSVLHPRKGIMVTYEAGTKLAGPDEAEG